MQDDVSQMQSSDSWGSSNRCDQREMPCDGAISALLHRLLELESMWAVWAVRSGDFGIEVGVFVGSVGSGRWNSSFFSLSLNHFKTHFIVLETFRSGKWIWWWFAHVCATSMLHPKCSNIWKHCVCVYLWIGSIWRPRHKPHEHHNQSRHILCTWLFHERHTVNIVFCLVFPGGA